MPVALAAILTRSVAALATERSYPHHMDMTANPTWADLQAELDNLKASLPQLRADHANDGDFLVAFAGVADQIRWRARHDDDFVHHVGIALTDMLIEAGLVPEEHRQH